MRAFAAKVETWSAAARGWALRKAKPQLQEMKSFSSTVAPCRKARRIQRSATGAWGGTRVRGPFWHAVTELCSGAAQTTSD